MEKKIIVDLSGLDLPAGAHKQVQVAVQRAALDTLARLDLRGEVTFGIPKEWLGIWLKGRLQGRIAQL